MLVVILLILKIIGILLLAVLGLFWLMVLIVLFTPIKYRINLEHGEELLILDGKLSWLFRIVRGRVSHMNGVFHILVKILWFTIYDNLKPRKPKIEKRKKVTKKSRVKKVVKSENGTTKVSRIKTEQKIENRESSNITGENQDTINKKAVKRVQKAILVDRVEKKQETALDVNPYIEEKESIFNRIYTKIKEFKEKVVASFRGLIEKIKKLFESIHNMKSKLDLIIDFLHVESNKEGLKITFESLKKVMKHILPKEFRSKIRFGTGDPYSTGQALGMMGMLYSFYGDNIQITPDFENKVLEGKHYARGRIRLITIIIIVIKLILDKRFKQFTKNIVILKEAL